MKPVKSTRSDAYFLDALRSFLGLCPLPKSRAAGKEGKRLSQQRSYTIPWYSGETDGCRRSMRRGSSC